MAGEKLVTEALCDEQAEAVRRAIYAGMAPDDRYPGEIVAADYDGNWDAYLRAMAMWHGIDLSQIGKAPENAG